MRTIENDIQIALKLYPALKTTINLAKKHNVVITRHRAQFTKRGAVSAHWLYTPLGWERNQILLGRLKHYNLPHANPIK